MKRPIGFTILSFILGWLSLSGLAGAVIELRSENGSLLIFALFFSYGVTALVSTVGLWKIKPWVYSSFLAWSMIVVATTLLLQFGMYGTFQAPLIIFLGFLVFILVVLALIATYIKKVQTRSKAPYNNHLKKKIQKTAVR